MKKSRPSKAVRERNKIRCRVCKVNELLEMEIDYIKGRVLQLEKIIVDKEKLIDNYEKELNSNKAYLKFILGMKLLNLLKRWKNGIKKLNKLA